jgi:tetratricopeptide (TPR) repeat protein
MSDAPFRHPLAALRAQLGCSASEYLRRLDARHRQLGHGAMATRREKVARWEAGVCAPELTAQLAMADLHGIDEDAVRELGWPHWLMLAFDGDEAVLATPWTPVGTVTSMAATARGGSVDRRGFLIASGTTLAAIATDWSGSLDQVPAAGVASAAGRRRLDAVTLSHLQRRLEHLRHLDDVLGGGELRRLAVAEFDLVSKLAGETVYDEATGRQLFSTVCEAGRLCGWLHFDSGLHAAAQKYYLSALRASATAGDPEIGANVLAFMAIQTYSVGDPHEAVGLVEAAQDKVRGKTTPLVRSILHARAARAWSKTPGGRTACTRELHAAREAFAQGRRDDDPPWAYWVTEAEIEMLAGSCALDLGDPRQALRFFTAARAANYAADGYARDNVLFLTRAADAHLALGQIDEACGTARQAYEQNGGVDSARPSSALADFRRHLMPHANVPAAAEFLELTT